MAGDPLGATRSGTPDRDWDELRRLPFGDWRPRSQLHPPVTDVERLAVPAFDIHNHLGRWLTGDGSWMIEDPVALVRILDQVGVETVVNLDGLWGDEVTANVERYDRAFPGRFVTFSHLEWTRLADEDGERDLRASLEDAARRGARGVKVWKNLGLTVRDADDALIRVDDERVVRLLARAGELGLPVLIHTGDPKAFFDPLDEHNERLDELAEQPDWWFGDRRVHPSFEQLMTQHTGLVAGAPGTTFIGAHVGGAAEDLDLVERNLAALPNYRVDIAGRLAELGRQPRRTRELIERFPDRILFGTDVYPADAESFLLHARFLETRDEAFEYAPGAEVPPQGRWTISAVGLPTGLLARVYRDNARAILAP